MFTLLMKQKFVRRSLTVVTVSGVIGAAFFIDGKQLFFPDKGEGVIIAASEEKPYKEIKVENVVVSESRSIDKSFAYENDHSYEFNINDSPAFVKIKESDNLAIKTLKSLGNIAVGKEHNTSLSSFYMIGYDMRNITENELYFEEESGTLSVDIAELEVTYKPMFELTEVEGFTGMFRIPYSDDQKISIYNDAINHGYESVISDVLVRDEAVAYIESQIKQRFENVESIKGKINQVKVNFDGNFIKVEEDVLAKNLVADK